MPENAEDGATVRTNGVVQKASLRPISVLIIDDDPAELAIISELLGAKGYKVSCVDNGITGLSQAVAVHPDIIVLDVKMPGMDGFETCRRLKENPATVSIPVIFLTGANQEQDVVTAFELGAVDYVTKPFRSQEILARIMVHQNLYRRLSHYELLLGETAISPHLESASGRKAGQLLGKATEQLLTHLVSPPTLRELAHRIGTNERTLSDLFRQELGMTPFQFLRKQRMNLACRLLADTEQPVGLIAEQVGYRRSGDFITAFKQTVGVTPSQFRKVRNSSLP